MTVRAAPEYAIRPQGDPPPGYPSATHPDSFQEAPIASTYDQRRAEFIAHVMKNPAPQNTKPVWCELVRMAGGGQPRQGVILSALDFIDARKDCSDFVMHSILRMLYQFSPAGQSINYTQFPVNTYHSRAILSTQLLERAKQTTLDFKYFPNEPGIDSLCTWTENHYILFTSAAYLAGQLYPEQIFTNSGETGRQKMDRNRPRILRWLDLRFRTGFSEWLSHVYYDEDLTALLSLYDFTLDEEIRRKAETVIPLLLLDIALNSFKGVFGSTHGRAYENTKKWASNEGVTDTCKLLFGVGIYSGFDNMSAAAFALSGYRVPPAIEAIARHVPSDHECLENRQRMGIKLNEMERWGLHPDNFEDGMHCLTLEAYLHPRTIANTLKMFDACNWWENYFFQAFKPYQKLLRLLESIHALPILARFLEKDICRNTREEVNIYTYRTSDYMLSTAQDYRKGFGGDQQHIWQATLGPDAVCFTTHPAKLEGVTPNYWAGSGLLPRAAQYKNLVIVIYQLKRIPALYVAVRHFFTHAWLPKDKFDEVIEKDGWIFARKGDGYLALHSQHPYFWNSDAPQARKSSQEVKERFAARATWRRNSEDQDRELIVPGARNIWLCHMGRKAEHRSFQQFVQAICSAKLIFRGMQVEYEAPDLGLVRFGWKGPLHVNGAEIPLNQYPRYDNPYTHAELDAREITLTAGEHKLRLTWE